MESLPPFSQAFVEVVCSQAAGRWSNSISLEQDLPPRWVRATAERGPPLSAAGNVAWRTWKGTGLRMCVRTNELTRQKGTHGLETGRGLAGPGLGRESWGAWDGREHSAAFEMDSLQGPAVYYTDLCSRHVAAGTGRGLGGPWARVHVWLSPFIVHLKLPQHH